MHLHSLFLDFGTILLADLEGAAGCTVIVKLAEPVQKTYYHSSDIWC